MAPNPHVVSRDRSLWTDSVCFDLSGTREITSNRRLALPAKPRYSVTTYGYSLHLFKNL